MARTEDHEGKKRITLCGVQGCCPVVEIDEAHDSVVITDDFGGKVQLTTAQWNEALESARTTNR